MNIKTGIYWLWVMSSASLATAQTNLVITGPVSMTPGDQNTLVGVRAGMTNTTATTGTNNTFGGAGAAQLNSTGSLNTIFGSGSGATNTTGNENVFVGAYVAYNGVIHVGSRSTYVGSHVATGNSNGSSGTYVGYQAGGNNGNNDNVFLGYQAGLSSGNTTSNTFIGTKAGFYTQASANTIIGAFAGNGVIGSGQFNTFVGAQAGLRNTSGSANIMMGTNAGATNQGGNGNFFLGNNSGGGNTTGSFNVYLGANAGNGANVNGFNNVAIGFESGQHNTSDQSNSSSYPNNGSSNTFLGFRADAGAGLLRNTTAIGSNAITSVSNAIVLGNAVNVGIGTSSPAAKLELASNADGNSGLRLTNLTSVSSTTLTSNRFLTVNEQGDVVLINHTGAGRQAAPTESFWESRSGFLCAKPGHAFAIGEVGSGLLSNYNLLVSKGILTERVKVAVKNSSDWSDYVFEKAYKLRPLSQVAQYIQTHRHLPDVPSAQEMVEQGNDLHRTDALLLAKIEELTLYVIEADQWDLQQQRELAQLRAENRRIIHQLNQQHRSKRR